MTDSSDSRPSGEQVLLRDPEHQVCERAVGYWRITSAIFPVVLIAALVVLLVIFGSLPWWGWLIAVVVIVPAVLEPLVMPGIRYRIHRWEVTDTAVYTRSGWLSTDQRIAPLSRVQTVDSHQSVFMRPFRLASITVTTASAAGPITIDCLDEDVARRTVAELTATTAATEGDAT